MRYLGGKSRIAKQLAEVIDSVRHPGQWVWDAFCGGLSMSVALRKKGPVLSTDANAALIALYHAVQAGWDPPKEATRQQRDAALQLPDSDPMKAFLRFGCGFAGNWASGFADRYPSGKTYASESRSSLLKTVCSSDRFACVDFLAVRPHACGAILYLDPPYAGTTGYAGAPPFDHDRFVQRVREWSRWTHVFVSEYSFPIGECVWAKNSLTQVANNHAKPKNAVERLYYLGPSMHDASEAM